MTSERHILTSFVILDLSSIMSAVTASQRQWIARLGLIDVLIVAALLLLIGMRRDDLHQALVELTGEQDTSFQLRALGFTVLSAFQAPHVTADFTPMRYTDVPPFGVNTFLEQEVEESKIRASLQLIRDGGFHFIRQEFPWEDIEQPGKGQFWDTKYNHSTWEKYDRIVALANEYGLQVIARLDHPPDWTRRDGHARGNFAPPDNYYDYGDFVTAVVSRYRSKIRFYQLWNEPNIYPEWGDQPVNAGDYARLLKLGYVRAKAVDPDSVIITAGLAQTTETGPRNVSDLIFLQQMYDAGARGNFDILGVQDYGLFTGPGDRRVDPQRTNFSRPVLIREIMVKNGDAGKPIWAMEVGWNAVPESFSEAPFGRVTQAQQAEYAVQAYRRAADEWPWMGVMSYWFFKRADDHEKDQPLYYFSLFDPDFTPHPVYSALKSYLSSARFLGSGYHPSDDWVLDFAGAWHSRPGDSGAADPLEVGQPGDSVSFKFHGTDLQLALEQNPYGGLVDVAVDGAPARPVDLRDTDAESQATVTIARGLGGGEHNAMITVKRGELRLEGILVRSTDEVLAERLALCLAAALAAAVGVAVWRS